jgi:hypothetical protein
MWGLLFLVLAYLSVAIPFLFFYHDKGSNPPTALIFVGVTIFCPLAGIVGTILGLLRKLPGTK